MSPPSSVSRRSIETPVKCVANEQSLVAGLTFAALQFAISFVGVIVFTGLAAYDAQRMKAMALALPSGQTGSYAIVGALALYLDFINLFLFLLRFTGSRRN